MDESTILICLGSGLILFGVILGLVLRSRNKVLTQAMLRSLEEAERQALEQAEQKARELAEQKARELAEQKARELAEPALQESETVVELEVTEYSEAVATEVWDPDRLAMMAQAADHLAEEAPKEAPAEPATGSGQYPAVDAERQVRLEAIQRAREKMLQKARLDSKAKARGAAKARSWSMAPTPLVSDSMLEETQIRRKILLADDSVTMRRIVEIALTDEHCTVHSVPTGEEAVEVAQQILPDLVIADLSMDGFDGYDVCKALKSHPRLKRVPVLLLHGSSSTYDESRARSVGADGELRKPFESQDLIDKVRGML